MDARKKRRNSSKHQMMESSILSLQHIFDEAIKFDTWGQRLEASEEYQKFLTDFAELQRPPLDDVNEKKLAKILKNVRRRGEILENATQTEDVNLYQMQSDFKEFCTIYVVARKKYLRRQSSVMVIELCSKNALLPPCLNKTTGQNYLTIKIEKIGLKDAETYVDPLFTVSVKDDHGRDILPQQNTKPSENFQNKCIIFNQEIHLQKSLEDLPKGFAIFFEFKHFKEKKQKVSTRCFAFIERDEIKNGCSTLEIYKKPVDYSRKKLYLFTEKPLYLHLILSLSKAN